MTKETTAKGPKRFYKSVTCAEKNGLYSILLDDRPISTPARAPLAVPIKNLADLMVQEWDAQVEEIDPETMPMTKRANTAIDRVKGREKEVVADIVSYAGADLLCYRAESPQGLVENQCALWDPILAWVKDELGAPLNVQTGISHIEQPSESLAAISNGLKDLDCFALTPLHTMTTLTGSALLVLAHIRERLNPEDVWSATHVDEDWQISKWGEDAEAQARRVLRRTEFDDDVKFLKLVKQ